MVATAPEISGTVSPRTRSAIRKPPIWLGVASPDIMMSKASLASSKVSDWPRATLAIWFLRPCMAGSEAERLLHDVTVHRHVIFGLQAHDQFVEQIAGNS